MTVKQHILDYLKGQDWVHKGKIEDQARGWGREVSNIDRRCRELHAEGKIDRRLNSKGHAEYQAILTTPNPRAEFTSGISQEPSFTTSNTLFDLPPTPVRPNHGS